MKRSLALAVVAIAAAVSTASGSTMTPQARIVFSADRAPSVSGEIYRLDPNGHRVDLSRSPYQDTNPVVSPDGKRVAFVSNRTSKGAVYEVGINGGGLRRVSPRSRLGFDNSTALAWQPQGRDLAISATRGFWIVGPGHEPINETALADGFAMTDPWSPDGRTLLVMTWNGGPIVALSLQGSRLWSLRGAPIAWSKQGLLAIADRHGSVAVYDERGQLRFKVRIGAHYASGSWSPDGSRLALIAWPTLREWTSTGQLVFHRRVGPDVGVAWSGQHRLIAAHPPSRWLDPRSADGRIAIVTEPKGAGFALGVARTAGGPVQTYGRVPGCWQDGVRIASAGSPQFIGRSIVYDSWEYCDEPFSNLYETAPDGSSLQRLTNVQAQETQPAVAPDGSEIAYVWAAKTGLSCSGCSEGIRVASAGGTPLRTLTDPQDCTFDDSPTWSPDGSTILFSESSCDTGGELYTVPAAGGPAHDLGIAGSEPAWGPTRIAYRNSGIWTANPDGSDPVRVTSNAKLPAWSSDGRLAYVQGGTTVVVGTTKTQLPFASVSSLAWSPDGTHFVITASKTLHGPPDVYTITTDGTDLVRLTENYDASDATWR